VLDLTDTRPIIFDESKSGVNVTDEFMLANVAHNIRLGYPQVRPFDLNQETAIIVCGGPSLAHTERELVEAVWNGGKVCAVNGAYQWCIDRNIKPSAAIMLDAREFNARFFATPVEGCRYLLAGQCHPKAFEVCKDRDLYIWHACGCEGEEALLREFYFGNFYAVDIGVTAGIRAITLLRMLGFCSMEIFGLDSCWFGDEHHAYEQTENDKDRRLKAYLRPRGRDAEYRDDKAKMFWCSGWHIKQAHTFLDLIRKRGDMFRLSIHGDGLLAAIMQAGAELQIEQED
jgi:hypothetical protein